MLCIRETASQLLAVVSEVAWDRHRTHIASSPPLEGERVSGKCVLGVGRQRPRLLREGQGVHRAQERRQAACRATGLRRRGCGLGLEA